MTDTDFHASVLTNRFNKMLLDRLSVLALPQCHLTAGCLFQTVWNQKSGHDPEWGIKDYDVFYFDDHDLSWGAEDQIIKRVAAATTDLPIEIEVRNQARVHLWYHDRFGGDYPVLGSARDGIDLYLVACTCVGIETETGALYAPNRYHDLADGVLRMNDRNPQPAKFRQKAESYKQRWPWLQIVDHG